MEVIVSDRSGEVAEYEVPDLSALFTQLSDEMKIDALCADVVPAQLVMSIPIKATQSIYQIAMIASGMF